MTLKQMIKNILKPFVNPFRKMHYNISCEKKLKKSIKNYNHDGPIVFICQCEYIWNKTRDVFKEVLKTGTKVHLYLIKDGQSVSKKENTIFEEEFNDFIIKYENVKLKDLKPSIVVYSRPYPNHLPKDVRITEVIKYAKTAYIPYYYSLDNLVETGINDSFYKCLSLYFADQECIKKHFEMVQSKGIKKGYQKVYNYGYPILERLYDNVYNTSIFKNPSACKIMWTPRWTIDEKLGGSNFLKYYKDMFSYFINNNNYSFVFRPHPLLFSNFIDKGIIKIEEKNEIMELFNNSNNSFHDTTSDYLNTFYHCDVLICDNSSIIIEYFFTGKPFIFCYNDSKIFLNDMMNKMLECNYVAHSFDEIIGHLNNITNGNDTKKELREQYLDEFVNLNKNSAFKISTELIKETK